ncbi:MAG: hypothetical protein PUC65_03360 [Clostridiales bacterium]|nr:hypothetical protein [Clostridiales bacterium]
MTYINFEKSMVSLEFRTENVLFPRKFKNTVIQKQDILETKFGSRVVVNCTEIYVIFAIILMCWAVNVGIYAEPFTDDMISYICLSLIEAVLVNIVFFRLILRMRMIIVKMKDGSNYFIPWKGNLLSRVSAEERREVEEIRFQLEHDGE